MKQLDRDQTVASKETVTVEVLERMLTRERRAREEAERLLESKSMDLYKAREESERQRQFMADAIEAMRDGFAVIDDVGRICTWNTSLLNLLLVPPDRNIENEVICELIVNAITGVHQEAIEDFKPDLVSKYIAERRIVEFKTKAGESIEMSVCPATGLGSPLTIRNISTRKKMEAQLVASQKQEALGTLAGGIAHEINTPTQYIGDNLRFVKDSVEDFLAVIDYLLGPEGGGPDRSEVVENDHDLAFLAHETPIAIQQALEGVSQIAKIVAAVKLYSHPSGEVRTEADIEELVENAVLVSKNEWKYVAVLEKRYASDLPKIPVFVDGIKQVLLNLIVNAAHAISEKSPAQDDSQDRIEINVAHTEEWLVLAVDDKGPGVPPHLVSRVFDPFFTTKAPGVGTGQGLAICKRIIVEQHGGRFEYQTSYLGGASFRIDLPLVAPE